MRFADRIERKLNDALAPEHLEIADDSHKHHGHAGWREGGETHFRVLAVSPRFEGLTRVDRQRLVYDVLAAELQERVHALQLTCRTPAEHAKLSA